MNEAADWNGWWKEAKNNSLSRRAAKTATAVGTARPGDAFLIVTEGVVTEPMYFDLLFTKLPLSSVSVKIVPGDASDPRHVINQAAELAKKQIRMAQKGQLGIEESPKFDHIWAVIDTDVAVRTGIWSDVAQLAKTRKVNLAHSTPCIEFWFLLHIVGYTTRTDLTDGATAKAAVRAALGREYSTNRAAAREAIAFFIDKWPEAIRHAEQVRRHHEGAGTPLPGNLSTEMCRLVRALNDSLPEPQRPLARN